MSGCTWYKLTSARVHPRAKPLWYFPWKRLLALGKLENRTERQKAMGVSDVLVHSPVRNDTSSSFGYRLAAGTVVQRVKSPASTSIVHTTMSSIELVMYIILKQQRPSHIRMDQHHPRQDEPIFMYPRYIGWTVECFRDETGAKARVGTSPDSKRGRKVSWSYPTYQCTYKANLWQEIGNIYIYNYVLDP